MCSFSIIGHDCVLIIIRRRISGSVKMIKLPSLSQCSILICDKQVGPFFFFFLAKVDCTPPGVSLQPSLLIKGSSPTYRDLLMLSG